MRVHDWPESSPNIFLCFLIGNLSFSTNSRIMKLCVASQSIITTTTWLWIFNMVCHEVKSTTQIEDYSTKLVNARCSLKVKSWFSKSIENLRKFTQGRKRLNWGGWGAQNKSKLRIKCTLHIDKDEERFKYLNRVLIRRYKNENTIGGSLVKTGLDSIPCTSSDKWIQQLHGPRFGGVKSNIVQLMDFPVFLEQRYQFHVHSRMFEEAH